MFKIAFNEAIRLTDSYIKFRMYIMWNRLKKISLGSWIIIGMILGLIFGIIINLFIHDPFIKDVVLMNNVFYLGGNVFIKLMKMLVVPLVFCSIVVGVASVSDIKTLGKIGGSTILIYLFTTAVGVTIALLVTGAIQPGADLTLVDVAPSSVTVNQSMTDAVLNVIPDNPINSLASGDMLPIIIFACLLGFILSKLKDESKTVNKISVEGDRIMIEMTALVMKFAPIGVFCLMAKTFGNLGSSATLPLLKYCGCLLLCLAIQLLIIYPSLLVAFTRLNPITFFRKFLPVMIFAFPSTSTATIPINLEKLTEMGVSKDVSSFTIPLGATINMDGTAIMQGVAVMFAAQVYGVDLGTSALITVIITAVIASVGTAAVPSAGMVTLSMVFTSVGLPSGIIGIIMGIDSILNMCRTTVNVTGDAICTIIVSFKNKAMDTDIFNGKKQPDFKNYFN